jgi:hypothetical protein
MAKCDIASCQALYAKVGTEEDDLNTTRGGTTVGHEALDVRERILRWGRYRVYEAVDRLYH